MQDYDGYETLDFLAEDALAVICLSRPEKLNSFNATMRKELLDAFRRLSGEARALLITGRGRAFCGGQDLGDVDLSSGVDLQKVLRQEYEPLLRAICDIPIPVVCAVNGPAAGAGANLALCCDLVLAGRSAAFIEAFSGIGLVPDAGGTFWLPRIVGMQRAMGMCLLAEKIDAETAEKWGLVWRVVDDAQLYQEAYETALRLSKGPTLALGLTKAALRASAENSFPEQLELEATYQAQAAASRDFVEGVAAFMEKRPAQFEGR